MSPTASWHRAVAILALITAMATSTGFAVLGDGRVLFIAGSAGYLALAAGGLAVPAVAVLQTLVGLTLAGASLLTGGATALQIAPLVAGVLAGTELLGVAARLRSPTARHPSTDLGRAVLHAAAGGGVFLLVALVGRLPGPTGLVAVALAATACAALAVLLVRTVLPSAAWSSILEDERV